ncbi:hypothetical protein RNM28_02770 [Mesomycoplasma ovipneumoniae]|uniref:hypothetical protein n=1 Tax=Mesomycoplasma ovipneumoniae TaxID=29562 RepID=UPI0028A84132|nr:hypothetical protein [Mesomycoplasma ovipneumoniae]WNM17065.1 hypothetical protein RNM28_02770 [Mesomycoplasma ovipneumoniae]
MTIFAVLAVVTNDFLSLRVVSVSSRSISSSWTPLWESTLTKTGSKLRLVRLEAKVATPELAAGVASFSNLTDLILYFVAFSKFKKVKS